MVLISAKFDMGQTAVFCLHAMAGCARFHAMEMGSRRWLEVIFGYFQEKYTGWCILFKSIEVCGIAGIYAYTPHYFHNIGSAAGGFARCRNHIPVPWRRRVMRCTGVAPIIDNKGLWRFPDGFNTSRTHFSDLMQFTLNDILQDFDSGTFGRGTDYARRGNVLSVVDTGKHIEAAVKGSSGEVYEQEIGWTQGRRGVMFEGSCTCPVGFNCKHVVAALLKYLEQMSSTPAVPVPMSNLPNAVAGWLQRLALAAQLAGAMPTEGKTGKPSKTTYRAIYILMPDSYARRVNLHLCKARLRVNDEVASASPVNEAHSLLSNPPAYVQPVDQYLARLFIAMRSGADWYSGAAAQPRGKIGDQLLRALLDEGRLFWANAQFDLQSGVVYPLKLGPARSGHLRWRWRALEHVNKNGEAGSALQLGWQFDDGAPIDAILPTEPAWYIDNLSIGELTLAQGASAIPIQDLQALVAQAPPVAARDQLALSRQLMAQGLDTIVPLPRALQHVLRSDIKPRPSLLLGSIAHGEDMVGNPQAYDFGTLSFNYDGVSVSIDPAQQALRQSGDSMELIQRDPAAEQAAYQRLTGLGFAAPTSG